MSKADGKTTGMMTQAELEVMGRTRMLEVLGESHDPKQDTWVEQHGRRSRTFRRGEPGRIVEFSSFDPHAAKDKTTAPKPCWVVRYEDGCTVWVPMDLPCYAFESRPPLLGRPKLWLEMIPDSCTRKARKVKGRD